MKTANRVKSLEISMLLVAAMGLTHSATASAQSGSRATAPRRVQPAQTPQAHGSQTRARDDSGSNQRNVAAAKLGLEGYCPVCVVVGKGWVKGDPQFQSQYDGVNYLFPSADVKQMFDAEPARFTPALGGDCVVCLQDLRKRIPGSLQFSSLYNDRLFLFPDANVKAKFDAAPDSYADADLAGGGQCSVCAVDMNQRVAGKPEFTLVHQGLRYLFPDAEKMKTFAANPERYQLR